MLAQASTPSQDAGAHNRTWFIQGMGLAALIMIGVYGMGGGLVPSGSDAAFAFQPTVRGTRGGGLGQQVKTPARTAGREAAAMLDAPTDADVEKEAMKRLEIRKKEAAAAGHHLETEIGDMSLVAIQALPPLGLLAKMFLDGAAADPSKIASVFAVMPAGDKKKVQMIGKAVVKKKAALQRQKPTGRMGSAANPKSSVRQARVAEREAKLASFGGFRDKNVEAFATSLPGNLPAIFPNQFFDPLRFCADIPEGKLCFYREVELKHGRVGMLASLGFLVGESFHPLFGGNIDVPSYLAFQQTPLQQFWPAVVAAIAIPEISQLFEFDNQGANPWEMKLKIGNTDREIGSPSVGNFDPLNLKPTDPAELRAMQDKEINNGRLAMLGAAGMIAQELVTGEKIFESNGWA